MHKGVRVSLFPIATEDIWTSETANENFCVFSIFESCHTYAVSLY